MFFKAGKVSKKKIPKYGRVFVFKITLKCGKVVHKVGMTHSDRATDRMFEVLRSFFNNYRYSPICELRRDKKVLIPLLVEKHLHELLDEWAYRFDKSFDGSTEFFYELDESVLLDYLDNFEYTNLLQVTSMKEDHLIAIRTAIDSQTPTNPTESLDKDKIPF
jgi:hypothetical protein